jgi:hypothetical protein
VHRLLHDAEANRLHGRNRRKGLRRHTHDDSTKQQGSPTTRKASTPEEPLMPRHDENQHGSLQKQVVDLQTIVENPLDVIYVVHGGSVNEYSISGLHSLARGSEPEQWREYTLFIDRTAADNFAKRQGLIQKAIKSIEGLSDENLAAMVQMIDERRVEEVAEFLNKIMA